MSTNVGKVIAAVRQRVTKKDGDKDNIVRIARELEGKWRKKQEEALFGVSEDDDGLCGDVVQCETSVGVATSVGRGGTSRDEEVIFVTFLVF